MCRFLSVEDQEKQERKEEERQRRPDMAGASFAVRAEERVSPRGDARV